MSDVRVVLTDAKVGVEASRKACGELQATVKSRRQTTIGAGFFAEHKWQQKTTLVAIARCKPCRARAL